MEKLLCFLIQSVGYGIYAGLSIAGIQSYYLPLWYGTEAGPYPVPPLIALMLLGISVYMILGAGSRLDAIACRRAK